MDGVLETMKNCPNIVETIVENTNLMFTMEVMVAALPPRFKVLQIEMLDGSKDPMDYLET